MPFSDFKTLSQVQTAYQIHYDEVNFIDSTAGEMPKQLYDDITFNVTKLDAFASEAARCELIILPILREAYKSAADNLVLWVQKSLRYDERLSGIPDYMVSKRSSLGKTVLESPILIVAEAKKNDFIQGWGQCLAELVAAQKLNNDEHSPVYGIVTDGKYWEFGQLTGHRFDKHLTSYSIDNLAELFRALNYIFAAYKGNTGVNQNVA